MRRIVTTFGGASYDTTLQLTAERAHLLGASEPAWIYDDCWFEQTDFRKQHAWAWDHPGHNGRKYGYGWYIFKPHVIRTAMSRLNDGDVLLWLDGDTYPITDFEILYHECDREGGMFLFEACGCLDRQWVKRDVWKAAMPRTYKAFFTDYEPGNSQVLDTQHATARFMLFQKGAPGVAHFLKEWERLCTTPYLTTRDPSESGPEFPGFEENRGDQSILSLLAHKYGIPLHREADAFGAASQKDRDLYGQLFEQRYCEGDRNDLSGSRYRNV